MGSDLERWGTALEPGHLSCLSKELSLARLVSTVSHQARQAIHSRMGQMVRYKSIVGPSGQLGRLAVARDGAAKSLSMVGKVQPIALTTGSCPGRGVARNPVARRPAIQ